MYNVIKSRIVSTAQICTNNPILHFHNNYVMRWTVSETWAETEQLVKSQLGVVSRKVGPKKTNTFYQ